jgi:hypothetical protein
MSITINTDDFKAIVNNSPIPNTSGFFVELMTSINAYVKGEFDSGRITGTEYATVYLGAMQSAIAQSVQYASTKATSDAQVALLGAQKLQVDTETAKTTAETALLTKQGNLLDAQTSKIDVEINKTVAETNLLPKQGDLLDAKIASESKTLAVADQQILLYAAQAKGFVDKSRVDSAKVLSDILSMRMSLSNDVSTGQSISDAFNSARNILPY